MMIDIGVDDKEDVIKIGIRLGQQIVFVCLFMMMVNEKKILLKVWDNRYGCGLSIEFLKELYGKEFLNIFYVGVMVQEEVGLRGVQMVFYMIKLDLFFVFDVSLVNDMSGDKNEFGQFGKGFLLCIFDRMIVMYCGMREFVFDMVEMYDILY